jgi:hypothetical protein
MSNNEFGGTDAVVKRSGELFEPGQVLWRSYDSFNSSIG